MKLEKKKNCVKNVSLKSGDTEAVGSKGGEYNTTQH